MPRLIALLLAAAALVSVIVASAAQLTVDAGRLQFATMQTEIPPICPPGQDQQPPYGDDDDKGPPDERCPQQQRAAATPAPVATPQGMNQYPAFPAAAPVAPAPAGPGRGMEELPGGGARPLGR